MIAKYLRYGGITVAVLLCATLGPVQASESQDNMRLMERLDTLEKRVAALEATRTFAGFMPELAERFHVMHRAGEAGDWAVAAHELAEMNRLTRQSHSIDVDRGKLMSSMLSQSYEDLEAAIGHGNGEKFAGALEKTVAACNACHVATGSNFVQVTLDAADGISMRHPHRLMMRDAPAGHHHGTQSTHMEPDEHGDEHGHASAGTHGHGEIKQQ